MVCHLGVLNFLCIVQYSSWCNHVMWLIGNSLPCCHGDQMVTGVPLHVTVATWWPHQSGTQPTRTQTCNSRAWICIWFHNTNTIWILQLCCVKSFHVGQNPCPILMPINSYFLCDAIECAFPTSIDTCLYESLTWLTFIDEIGYWGQNHKNTISFGNSSVLNTILFPLFVMHCLGMSLTKDMVQCSTIVRQQPIVI